MSLFFPEYDRPSSFLMRLSEKIFGEVDGYMVPAKSISAF